MRDKTTISFSQYELEVLQRSILFYLSSQVFANAGFGEQTSLIRAAVLHERCEDGIGRIKKKMENATTGLAAEDKKEPGK